jgi:hypothetical protein
VDPVVVLEKKVVLEALDQQGLQVNLGTLDLPGLGDSQGRKVKRALLGHQDYKDLQDLLVFPEIQGL